MLLGDIENMRLPKSTSEAASNKSAKPPTPMTIEQLYDQYIEKIYNFTYYRTHHKETAEDLTSIIFEKVFKKFDSFDQKKGNIVSWLYTIARNTVTDHYRTQKKYQNIDDVWDLKSNENIEKDIDTKLKLEKVQKYLQTLKPLHRDIVIMKLWDGLSYEEIAEITGKSKNALKMITCRTLKQIREQKDLLVILITPLIINL